MAARRQVFINPPLPNLTKAHDVKYASPSELTAMLQQDAEIRRHLYRSKPADDDAASTVAEASAEPSRPGSSGGGHKDEATKPEIKKPETMDPKLVGMSAGIKKLYSGKEDKHGRFQWQDTIPEHVLKPAEDTETMKLALILRYVKVYTDPRKTLGLHSVVIQSPLLKELLETVLAGYPGVTVGLQRLEFSGKFEPLIHRFPELKAAIEVLKTKVAEEEDLVTHARIEKMVKSLLADQLHGSTYKFLFRFCASQRGGIERLMRLVYRDHPHESFSFTIDRLISAVDPAITPRSLPSPSSLEKLSQIFIECAKEDSPAENSDEQQAEEPAIVEDAAEEPIEDPAIVEESAEELIEKLVNMSVEGPSNMPVEKPVEKSVGEPIEKPVATKESVAVKEPEQREEQATTGGPTDKPSTNGVDGENATSNGDAHADSSGETVKVEEPIPVANNALKLEHAQLLHDCIIGEFQALLDSSQDMKSQSVMTYESLWTLFQPGSLIFSRQEGQDRVFKLKSSKYGLDRDENPVYWLSLNYIDHDGSRFGFKLLNVSISAYAGTRPISSLKAFPMEFHAEQDATKAKLIARGAKIEAFSGTHYRAYNGIGWKFDSYGEKEKHSVNGRIIIDSVGWNRYNPNQAIYVQPLNRKGDQSRAIENFHARMLETLSMSTQSASSAAPWDGADDDCCGGMPLDGHFGGDEDSSSQLPLNDEQKLLCTPLVRGYALKEKIWLNLFVNSVQDITFNTRAFESLVLPENQKELILGFTDTQQAFRNTYDDVIEGKGRGIIILLCGPPGVGKTLTAESVAEEMKVPLFTMSAGDLGADSRHIESRLLAILGMCTRWNAICLLDEAEIFLEARSLHELERNRIVSIFLRVLEYHEGIMFLTTNLVKNFDPAFQSRIHISLDYPELSSESRLTVWKGFLKQHDVSQAAARENPPKNPASSIQKPVEKKTDSDSGGSNAATNATNEEQQKKRDLELLELHQARTQPHAITDRQMESLALRDMNGRQIKNILKTAQLLASRKAEPLKHAHITTVLEVTQHLHNSAQESDRARSSIFN